MFIILDCKMRASFPGGLMAIISAVVLELVLDPAIFIAEGFKSSNGVQ